MHSRTSYIMRDQVRNRVVSIMSYEPRHAGPGLLRSSRGLILTAMVTCLYVYALTTSG